MKMDKIMEKLSEQQRQELDALDEAALNKVVAESQENINQATAERDGNVNYQAARTVIKDFNAGLKGVKDFQNAKIGYALARLKELKGE